MVKSATNNRLIIVWAKKIGLLVVPVTFQFLVLGRGIASRLTEMERRPAPHPPAASRQDGTL